MFFYNLKRILRNVTKELTVNRFVYFALILIAYKDKHK